MNSILNDYSTITELELNKRISYYEHMRFLRLLFAPQVYADIK